MRSHFSYFNRHTHTNCNHNFTVFSVTKFFIFQKEKKKKRKYAVGLVSKCYFDAPNRYSICTGVFGFNVGFYFLVRFCPLPEVISNLCVNYIQINRLSKRNSWTMNQIERGTNIYI